jgi:hypothetical protein
MAQAYAWAVLAYQAREGQRAEHVLASLFTSFALDSYRGTRDAGTRF